ncbi:hypothetical protein EGY05_21390 [Chryseobacterium arthrosphaerae]|nr:hypothetical protein EGY05_21390 [Chryseobacterium arthrosphaerae]
MIKKYQLFLSLLKSLVLTKISAKVLHSAALEEYQIPDLVVKKSTNIFNSIIMKTFVHQYVKK